MLVFQGRLMESEVDPLYKFPWLLKTQKKRLKLFTLRVRKDRQRDNRDNEIE